MTIGIDSFAIQAVFTHRDGFPANGSLADEWCFLRSSSFVRSAFARHVRNQRHRLFGQDQSDNTEHALPLLLTPERRGDCLTLRQWREVERRARATYLRYQGEAKTRVKTRGRR